MWKKPRMRPAKEGWLCHGAGCSAVGATQRDAYRAWAASAGVPAWLAEVGA